MKSDPIRTKVDMQYHEMLCVEHVECCEYVYDVKLDLEPCRAELGIILPLVLAPI